MWRLNLIVKTACPLRLADDLELRHLVKLSLSPLFSLLRDWDVNKFSSIMKELGFLMRSELKHRVFRF